jgi:hypothetical protein
MKPAIQASNIRFCNIKSNAATIKWDSGDGERRIVIITPEIKVNEGSNDNGTTSDGPTYEFGDNHYDSTYGNPDPLEVRQNFPGHYPGYKADFFNFNTNNISDCNGNTSYLSPKEALPIDGNLYKPSIIFGNGDELSITTRGATSSDPSLCPSPSPSPSPTYEIIEGTGSKNKSFVVYEGMESEVTVLNLKPETGYYVGVFEFNTTDCIEYLHEPSWSKVITSCFVETGHITFTVTDCRTCRPIVSIVEVIDKYGMISDLGSTNSCGEYKTNKLETSMGYKIKVYAPNYDDYIINNIFVQPRPDLRESELHPNWTQGTRILPFFTTPDDGQNTNHYDVKM